ncbi:MAG: hypothetical protein CM15mV4_1710 [Caudoviricetes sp.]|nr:MAG: hypothetical protein CM15mV4_1710 [Caudoviricetes sp.]
MGDVFWYLAQACLALNVDFQTVVMTNMMKLAARYPDGKFDISKSEVRKEGTSNPYLPLNKLGGFSYSI